MPQTVIMLHELTRLDLETLKHMYAGEADKLKTSLLNGATWEEVQEYRHRVIRLEAALYQKIRSGNLNPAEFSNEFSKSPYPHEV
jgi:hypothetical protein